MNKREVMRRPEWMADWKVYLLLSLISFAFAFGLRCLDLPKWDNPSFMVNGEYIMGTHDAYFWLAGAKGVGSAVDNPMAYFLSLLSSLTGAQLGNLAFWLPAVLAGVTAIAAFAWGGLLAGPWAGLVAAVYTTALPAYYFRTRLSYYDTDLVTLLFPLIITFCLAAWLKPMLRNGWLRRGEVNEHKPTLFDYMLPVFGGGLSLYGFSIHQDIQAFGLVASIICAFLSLVCCRRGGAKLALRGVVLFAVAGFFNIYGFVCALVLAYLFSKDLPEIIGAADNHYAYLALFIAMAGFSGTGILLFDAVWLKIVNYLKPVADSAVQGHGPLYPGIAQSVIEAQNININEFLSNVCGSTWLGTLGFISFFGLLFVNPAAVFLLPFALASFAALTMGGRFAMFGGVALGAGIGVLLHWAALSYFKKEQCKVAIPVGAVFMALLLPLNNYSLYDKMGITPIMYKEHAQALIESRKVMEPGSTVWTWWDWGYATMYYTGQNSFANGGNHAGPIIYPLALAYTTPSFLQSSQVIKYSALQGNNPADAWKNMTGSEVNSLLKSFGERKLGIAPKSKQYLVVSWKDISLAYWILYYGSWNVASGQGIHPNTSRIFSAFKIDYDTGTIQMDGGNRQLPLSSYSILSKNKVLANHFKNRVGGHLIYNTQIGDGFIFDDYAYSSMLTALMVANPRAPELKSHFKLLYEGAPMVRVYEVL